METQITLYYYTIILYEKIFYVSEGLFKYFRHLFKKEKIIIITILIISNKHKFFVKI